MNSAQPGCGSSSCIFSANGGMRTNGPCRCYENAGFHGSAVMAARQMLPELLKLRAAHAWIKTSERLPAHGERCLVYADFAGTVLCVIGQYIPYADSDLRPWRIHHGQERFLYAGMASIVGWQSLPEPPK